MALPADRDVTYKAFRRFNTDPPPIDPHSRARVVRELERWFGGDSLEEKLARALVAARALPYKEILESFEFHARVRKVVRRSLVVDLCAGHGLTGMVFAAFERSVEEVWLVDKRKPDSVAVILDAVASVAPWVPDKVRFHVERMERVVVPEGAGVLGVHACGKRTDGVIAAAVRVCGPVAVMPCCHGSARPRAPEVLRDQLGVELATDVHRTYRLEAAGYQVGWRHIPSAITPMNRILVGRPADSG